MIDATQNETPELSAHESQIIRHALGLTRSRSEYRNFFAAEPGSLDGEACAALARRGLMRCGNGTLNGRVVVYHVTNAGKAAIAALDAKEQQ